MPQDIVFSVALIFIVLLLIVLAFFFGRLWSIRIFVARRIREAEQEAVKIREDARQEADNLIKEKMLEVKEEWYRKKQEFDEQTKAIKSQMKAQQDEFLRRERSLEQRGDWINRKEKELGQKDNELKNRIAELEKKEKEVEAFLQIQNAKLEQIARLSAEEAKRMLMEHMMERAKNEAAQHVRQIHEKASLTAKEDVRNLLLQAMERSAIDQVVETTVTVVSLPNNEMKGRIIGREGRNIRAFETITGCEVLIDDTPNKIVISGFDPIRREIAKIALDMLVNDGRIHPGRIEDVVEKARRELDETIIAEGERALFEASVHGAHLDIVRLIGKLKYIHMGGHNLLQHSIETAMIAGMLAAELGLDVQLAKRAGILHDLGYAAERTEQHHSSVGADLARKYGESLAVQQAIQNHHEDPLVARPLDVIVYFANLLSKERPGASREFLELHLQRVQVLEELARSFPGVLQAFAVQSGREVRIMVDCAQIDDAKAILLADEVAQRIENELTYAGQIKITVIREFRAVDIAK